MSTVISEEYVTPTTLLQQWVDRLTDDQRAGLGQLAALSNVSSLAVAAAVKAQGEALRSTTTYESWYYQRCPDAAELATLFRRPQEAALMDTPRRVIPGVAAVSFELEGPVVHEWAIPTVERFFDATVTDLSTQLRAAIQERMTLAQEATPELMLHRGGEEYVAAGPVGVPVCVAATGPADDPQSMADARLIAAVASPEAVIRACEADLRVLERHVPLIAITDLSVFCPRCRRNGWGGGVQPWPCDDIRDLAARYGIEVTG